MAGLVAAARARELGARAAGAREGRPARRVDAAVERRDLALPDGRGFRAECPGGDPALQRLIVERLDDALEWLESLGAPVIEQETGNPRTIGMRFDPRGLTDALVRAAGRRPFRTCVPARDWHRQGPTATRARDRGLPRRELARERRRCRSAGESVERGRRADRAGSGGARRRRSATSSTAATCPHAPFGEADFVPLAQLYGRFAAIVSEDGARAVRRPADLVGDGLVQATARWPGARAWYLLARERGSSERVRERTRAD